MTLTRTETASSAGVTASTASGSSPLGRLVAVPASGDHKTVGRLWIGASLIFGLITLVAGAIASLERALGSDSIDLDGIVNGFESYGQYWTLHRIGVVFLVVVPLFIGIATHVVPLQLGASSVAFPRAASAAFWTWLVSASIMVVSWLIDGGFVDGGAIDAVNLSLASFAFVLIALGVGSLVIATTVITQRVEGLWLERTPLFSWSMLIAATMWLLTLPVLLANVVFVWIDHQGSAAGNLARGDQIFEQFAWAVDHPQIFAWLIPLLGIVGEIVPTAFGDRPRGHAVSQGAIALFGLLSFGAWAQPFFSASTDTSPIYVLSALVLAMPVLVLAGGWGDLARRADGARPGVHVIFGFLALAGLLAAGATAGVRVLHALLRPAFGGGDGNDEWVRSTQASLTSAQTSLARVDSPAADVAVAEVASAVADFEATVSSADSAGTEAAVARIESTANEAFLLVREIDSGSAADSTALSSARSALNETVRFAKQVDTDFGFVEGLELYGTSATSALYTLATAAGLAAAIAGLYFWAPKIYGRKLNTGLIGLAALSVVGGAVLSGITDLISGFNGQLDDAIEMARNGSVVSGGTETLNWLSTIGTFGIAAGTGLALLAILATLAPLSDDYWEDEDAANPWGGSTLEWSTLSPPPLGNFAGPPEVNSPYPLLDGSDD